MTKPTTKTDYLLYGGVFFLLTMVELRFLHVFLGQHISEWIDASHGIVIGQPHWRAVAHRILAPYIVHGLSQVTASYQAALIWFLGTALFAAKVLWFYLVERLTGSAIVALRYTVLFSAMFVMMQDRMWILPWDIVDLLVFSLFAYGIYKGCSIRFFVVLFFVELFNREAALFIALWILLEGMRFVDPRGWWTLEVVHRGRAVLGGALMIGGMAVTKWLRDTLFETSHFTWVGTDEAHRLIGNHIYFSRNVGDFFRNFASLENAAISLGLLAVVVLLKRAWRKEDRMVRLTLLWGAMVFNIFFFGLINETRMWQMLIPFVLLLVLQGAPQE